MKILYLLLATGLTTYCVVSLDRLQTVMEGAKEEKAVQMIKLSNAGGREYAPYVLLRISNSFATVFHYDNELNLSDQQEMKGSQLQSKFLPLLSAVPEQLIHSGGGDFSSPVDGVGYLIEITLRDGRVNKWGLFPDDYTYPKELIIFLNKLNTLIEAQ